MKNIHNYIAIFVLILVMSGIIIAFSTISKSDTLNTSKTEETNISKEEDPAIDKNILKSMMKTQISSVKGLEEIEAKQKEKSQKAA